MSKPLSGSCLCGALSYESSAEPLFQGFCQCTDCRKVGSGHYAAIGLPGEAVTVTGEYKAFGKRGESGQMIYRHFCPDCGGVVFDKGDAFPGVTIVNAALLDDPSRFTPDSVIFTRSAVPWDHIDPGLTRHEATPPME